MEIERFMTEHLQQGFAGGPVSSRIENGLTIKSVGFVEPEGPNEGSSYFDQWTKGRLGVGMEAGCVVSGEKGESLGRVYAGGTLPDEELNRLGITRDIVLDKIKEVITKYGSKTRLFEDFHPEPDGSWKYSYEVIGRYPEFELYIAEEKLNYRENLVFIHPFLISPVKR